MYDTYETNSAANTSFTPSTIALQMGERRFTTIRNTLVVESGFFASLLFGRWNNAMKDGAYFIDADANLFDHILRYLRREVFPLFFDKSKGYDHGLYFALLEEARYFKIKKLEQWLKKKRYLDVVKIVYSVTEIDETESLDRSHKTDTEVEFHSAWITQKVYVCPQDISNHRGKPSACGKNCRRAQGNDEVKYEDEPVLTTLMVEKRTVFDMQVCLDRENDIRNLYELRGSEASAV